MVVGYVIEQTETFGPPIPSGIVLFGHLCVVLQSPRLTTDFTSAKIINLIFLISNILMFFYDILVALGFDVPVVSDLDQFMTQGDVYPI